ncbi:protein phosphatase 1 regulatory subunit 35-like [Macrobrachium rosenbergii]|uniref:protein phosphatase 1 regulatory subunit 35-like n=1 Tax=Macrobrachium rosenbergii TaxID=79674 RepID=UPI0034D74CD6
MATADAKVDRITINCERHIDVVAAKNAKDSDGKVSKVPYMNPPLVNLQTKNIPTGRTVNHVVRKGVQPERAGRPLARKEAPVQADLPESAEPVYGEPEMHFTLRVGEALVKAKNKKPDLARLVEDKLQSPTTESRYKKEASKGVSIPATKKVFSELVSVDVSEQALAKVLDEQLQLKAAAVHPPLQAQDPEPQMSDYFNPEDYVTRARVTSARRYRPFSSVKPQTVQREDYLKLCDYFLSSSFR